MLEYGDATHPFLCGLSLKVFIHIPVALPLPAAGGKPEVVQRLVLQTRDITPLPAVAWQQTLRETIDRIPSLTERQTGGEGMLEHAQGRNTNPI